jgi:hypothetical protein
VKAATEQKQGYGNIYTPHAGEMIIHVHRASGLANRTIILGPRGVKILRWFLSRSGIIAASIAGVSWVVLAVQAARVPLLERRITTMQADSARLDTLERTLTGLSQRYDQLQRLMAATPATTTPAPVPTSAQSEH